MISLSESQVETNQRLPRRMAVVLLALVAGFGAVGWRLYILQYCRHEELSKRVAEISRTQRMIPAVRGAIRDRSGRLLAHDCPTFDVWANTQHLRFLQDVKLRLSKIENKPLAELTSESPDAELVDRYTAHVAAVLADALARDVPSGSAAPRREELIHQLSNEKRVEFSLAAGLPADSMDAWQKMLKDQHIQGITLRQTMRRFYPVQEHLVNLLGFVDHDYVGKEGIEASMDATLAGKNGSVDIECDRKGREIPRFRGAMKDPQNGRDVWLTIDMPLQEMLDQILEEAVVQLEPKKIVSVIVEPRTGAILAMSSSRPKHASDAADNDSHQYTPSSVHGKVETTASPAIADEYEPGSVFKLITFTGVFDRKLADMGEMIDCDPDQRAVASLGLHDHVSGKVTVAQVLSKSSNVGSYMLARRLGEDSFIDYVSRFGFGKRTGIALTGEAHGRVMFKRREWDGLTFSRMVIGHSISVTPLQMAMATAAIANRGELMKPQIVREVRDSSGALANRVGPEVVRRVCSPQAAALVAKAMEGVVSEHGTGKKAQIPGVRVAGKTGTSQRKRDGGAGYEKGHYVVSFSGFAPVEDPQLCVIVVVDDPHGPPEELTGGTLAGPIFAQIMNYSLNHLAVTSRTSLQAASVSNGGAP